MQCPQRFNDATDRPWERNIARIRATVARILEFLEVEGCHDVVSALQREANLADARGKLERGEASFADLAAALSDDPASKTKGGELGWMHAGRLAPDFAAQVLTLPEGTPSLIRTKIGWHLVEVLER